MAHVIPFKGIRYNPEKITDLAQVVTPPYDVISPEEQVAFHNTHPNNAIRLVLGKTHESDTPTSNWFTRASDHFNRWIEDDTLIQDDNPAFYLTSLEFSANGHTITRYGIIGMVRVEPFEKRIVLPHERTFSKVKSERLQLMKAANANFCPIFSLYSDPNDLLGELVRTVKDTSPIMALTDSQELGHKMWPLTDPEIQKRIKEELSDRRIFIADGHHRYETALNYRNWISQNTPDFSSEHPANYVMMYLTSMSDPGLIILPAHRMLKEIDDNLLAEFIHRAEPYFDIITMPFSADNREKVCSEFLDTLEAAQAVEPPMNRIGVYKKDSHEFYLLTLKPGVMDSMFGDEFTSCSIDAPLSTCIRYIDVTVLTHLLFMEVLGFDQARLDNEKLIGYSSIARNAISGVDDGACDITFILNPTRIDQVQAVAGEGLIMPRKATYFYPKVITGQVMNRL